MTSASPARAIEIPGPSQIADVRMSDGAVVRLRRYARDGAPRLVLSHGNGLAIDAYVPFWAPLRRHFDVVVFDVRNHGENPLHDDPSRHAWPVIIEDLEALSAAMHDSFGAARNFGVFHSLSAIASIDHALTHPSRWQGLVLFDPPTYPPDGHTLQALERREMEIMRQRALRRPSVYDSPDELAAQFARRATFRRWVPGAHELVARTTLRQREDGKWALRLPRDLEAHIYSTNTDAMLWPRMRTLKVPLMLIASDPACADAAPSAFTCRALHEELGIAYTAVPDTSHFLQIEQPEQCRRALYTFLASCGGLPGSLAPQAGRGRGGED